MNRVVQIPESYNGILIVGEAPGAEEKASIRYNEKYDCYIGKPFIGKEGRYLRGCCKIAEFPFDDCVVINTVHEQPSGNKYQLLPKHVVEEGRKELIATINKFKPKLIVAIGNEALFMLTGKSGIMKYRGTMLPSELVEGYDVFATIHPGFVFKGMPQYDIVLKIDLGKAAKYFKKPVRTPEYDINVIYDKSEALKVLYDSCYLEQQLFVDIETGGPQLLAFGVATSTTEAFVITKDLCKEPCVLRAISEFSDSNAKKCYHNGMYDVSWLAYHLHIFSRNFNEDTLLRQHAIFPTLPKSLAFCSSLYTDQVYWKEEGKEVIKDYGYHKITDWHSFYIYNGKDCCVTGEVFYAQEEELDHWKVRGIYHFMMKSVPHALISTLNGFEVDWDELNAFKEKNKIAIKNLERITKGICGSINLNSAKQTAEYFYKDLKLPVRKKKGRPTTDENALLSLEALPTVAQHIIGLTRNVRKHIKLKSFYEIKVAKDGKVHWSNKIHGALTGRWATSKDIVTDSGSNMQNRPKETRCFYKVPEGKIAIEWDLSNVDARFVAALCEDEDWLRAFDIIDQHSFTGVHLFKIEPFYSRMKGLDLSTESLKKFKRENEDFIEDMYKNVREKYSGDKTYRDYSKRAGHATHYLEGPHKLHLTLCCSKNEATSHIATYKKLRPKLNNWHNRVRDEVGDTRMIRTCFDRVIQFFGPPFFIKTKLPEIVAAEPQSCAGDYLMTGALRCFDAMEELEFKLQVHDSIMVFVDDDVEILKTLMPRIKELCEFDITVRGITFKIPIDFKLGYNWGHLKDVKKIDDIDTVYRALNNEVL